MATRDYRIVRMGTDHTIILAKEDIFDPTGQPRKPREIGVIAILLWFYEVWGRGPEVWELIAHFHLDAEKLNESLSALEMEGAIRLEV